MFHNLIYCILVVLIYYVAIDYFQSLDVEILELNENGGPVVFMIGCSHGDEIASYYGLKQLIKNIKSMDKEKKKTSKFSRLIILPKANKSGWLFNSRFLIHRLCNRDLNRNYPQTENEEPREPISKEITEIVKNVDYVVDFHEGLGFVRENKGSMGSGIFPDIFSIDIAKQIETEINKNIKNPIKKFKVSSREMINETLYETKISNTLADYTALMKKKYILIETTKTQDISVRKQQVYDIATFFLFN